MSTRRLSRSNRATVIATVGVVALSVSVASAQPVSPALSQTLEEPTMSQGQGNVRQGPLSPEDMALVKRWAELFAAVLGEFQANHRDPVANIEGDFSVRMIRVRRVTGADQWVERTLTKKELGTEDLRALAKRLYEASLKDR
jgi:hypothetical protein